MPGQHTLKHCQHGSQLPNLSHGAVDPYSVFVCHIVFVIVVIERERERELEFFEHLPLVRVTCCKWTQRSYEFAGRLVEERVWSRGLATLSNPRVARLIPCAT